MYAQLSVSAQHLVFALLTAADVVEQWPFKPKVVGSIPTAPTSFLIHFTGLAKTARQQKAALTAGQRRRASKNSRHGWQANPIIRWKWRDCNAGGFPCCSNFSVPKFFRGLFAISNRMSLLLLGACLGSEPEGNGFGPHSDNATSRDLACDLLRNRASLGSLLIKLIRLDAPRDVYGQQRGSKCKKPIEDYSAAATHDQASKGDYYYLLHSNAALQGDVISEQTCGN